jgi:hypothetical protein
MADDDVERVQAGITSVPFHERAAVLALERHKLEQAPAIARQDELDEGVAQAARTVVEHEVAPVSTRGCGAAALGRMFGRDTCHVPSLHGEGFPSHRGLHEPARPFTPG